MVAGGRRANVYRGKKVVGKAMVIEGQRVAGGRSVKESFLASITHSCQEFSARPSKNNSFAGKEI
jgi:hypothetical protein